MDTGQLHLIAAAAAVRTGVGFAAGARPFRHGLAALPGPRLLRGLPGWQPVEVRYDAEARVLTVAGGGQEVRVPDPPGRASAGWRPRSPSPRRPAHGRPGRRRPVPHLPGGDRRAVRDASRAVARPLGAAGGRRLGPAGARRPGVRRGRGRLSALHRAPTRPKPYRWHSATLRDAMGGMAASEPAGTEPAAVPQFAAALAHEVQHSKLGALMHMYALHTRRPPSGCTRRGVTTRGR
ncbi:HEXXH motif-containing putative peptide modification protein [Streptomyces sp. M19]